MFRLRMSAAKPVRTLPILAWNAALFCPLRLMVHPELATLS